MFSTLCWSPGGCLPEKVRSLPSCSSSSPGKDCHWRTKQTRNGPNVVSVLRKTRGVTDRILEARVEGEQEHVRIYDEGSICEMWPVQENLKHQEASLVKQGRKNISCRRSTKKVEKRLSWRPVRSCRRGPGERGEQSSLKPLWQRPKAVDGIQTYFRNKTT